MLRYRSRLGGFYSADQVGEVYGLDTAVYKTIRPHLVCSPGPLRRLALNSSPLDSLKRHPYLPPWVAADIVSYRNKHEGFVSMDELRSIRSLKDSLHRKVLPYLELGEWAGE
jgi:DNA uptake protein ComE-like DNA-binding protein